MEPTFNISFDDISKAFKKIFEDTPLEKINIVFVTSEYIQQLNKQYRNIEAPTDVLSFKISEDMKESEIYICPEYVYESFKGDSFEEEILRLIVHGTLHILGYDHKESLNDSPNEDMFVLQEELLLKFKKLCL
ncbi:rRNA maturation RNase YbeY [candidate division WS6 bacterium RIFOXYD1_FULL_33_8]|nr:MAG: rRNA maturation RNase YbeY [candidate division WS6 bacterium RIFOXYB1_FULL_33_15]OGC37867.1 MAG: rRNA maturation RNase YbeY [candidate division WS6 bacterium RIFOXYC1_FULL_33_9]OGC42843.1 MAG: rRNA maturation RNase YbeY [candidate division WS6 bacterium RIFOXYD1_FULL_33_8]